MAKAIQTRIKRIPEVVPVVGIGASAGGLEAFRNFLNALPANTGMAFVLIPHLIPTQKNLFGRLLSQATSMLVTQVLRRSLA
jgi:two-component system, chemotaxis family, CheB/CheR fusion protein